MNEILLPVNAPEQYQNREILWNEVQKIEYRANAQLAREVEVALPVELTRANQIECVRTYIQDNFVSKGMIADWALHDKNDGNPHVHIMLTVRGFDDNKMWMQKQKSVFANSLDNNGKAIYDVNLPVYSALDQEGTSRYRIPQMDETGKQKIRVRKGKGTEHLWKRISIPMNDWNEQRNAEIWRASWAEHCNRYLDFEHRIDHRSYERQGIDRIASIHEGVTARKMELNGKISERCQKNREIFNLNMELEQLRKKADDLTRIILEKARNLYERFRKFGRSSENARSAGGNAWNSGEAAERDRKSYSGEHEFERAAGRIHAVKRAVSKTERAIKETDKSIKETNSRIAELQKALIEKEREISERLRRFYERRRRTAAVRDRADADGNRKTAAQTFRECNKNREPEQSDTEALIREIEAEIGAAKSKERNSEKERSDREVKRRRSALERAGNRGRESEENTPGVKCSEGEGRGGTEFTEAGCTDYGETAEYTQGEYSYYELEDDFSL